MTEERYFIEVKFGLSRTGRYGLSMQELSKEDVEGDVDYKAMMKGMTKEAKENWDSIKQE